MAHDNIIIKYYIIFIQNDFYITPQKICSHINTQNWEKCII